MNEEYLSEEVNNLHIRAWQSAYWRFLSLELAQHLDKEKFLECIKNVQVDVLKELGNTERYKVGGPIAQDALGDWVTEAKQAIDNNGQ